MALIDMRTVFFIMMIMNGICTLFLSFSWRQDRSRYKGLDFWVADFFLQTISILLLSLRGIVSDGASILLGNTLIILGSVLGYMGLEYFLDRKSSNKYNIAIIVSFIPLYAYFTFSNPDLAVRSLLISSFWLLGNLRCLYLMLHKADKSTLSFTKPIIYSYIMFAIVSIARVVKYFIGINQSSDYLHSGLFETVILCIILTLFVILAYSKILTLNKRLLQEIKKKEEKYSKVFSASPNAIMLTHMTAGKIIEVNKGFMDMLEFGEDDLRGKSTEELNIWMKKDDRIRFVNEMKEFGKVRNLEMDFRRKSGTIMTGVLSADVININGENVILSITNDISKRKAMEEQITEMSNRDPLTNAYNRRYVFIRLEKMLKEYMEFGKGFSISIIDIDHFKLVNDTYGHQGGDVVLIELTKTINSFISDCDFLGRYGGEEFIIISCGTNRMETSKSINKILQHIRDSSVSYDNKEITYTFSGGISDCFEFSGEDLNIEKIVNTADARLYEAKENGRNRILF